MFVPNAQQFATQIRVQHRVITEINGSSAVSFQDATPALDFCNWKGKGGTSSNQSGPLLVLDTADVTMWYRPDISEQDRILLNDDDTKAYEVLNVENIEQRGMWMVLKVVRAVLRLSQVAQIFPCTGYGRRAPEYGAPVETMCRIDQKIASNEIIGLFPVGISIKAGDRVECEGKAYLVAHVAEDPGLANVAHVEVVLHGLQV